MDPRIVTQQLHQLPKLPTKFQKQPVKQNSSFQHVLDSTLHGIEHLKVSKHAEKRLQERGITIDHTKWEIIYDRIQEAKQKGVSDSLVLLKEGALVVSAKNNTVITVLDRHEAKSQIFTNINGTIVID
ncbi:TIGR02530 family flagellar biosynthesis protein [Anaerobacillus sp. MEB173]|uniref:TIGR02530 family flagellar biosynthesis protein n=1 Tax=Anaerobacillus sp. MEB173 TaxID=3383345 RepID=UPI003F93B425